MATPYEADDPYPNPSTRPVLAVVYRHANQQGSDLELGPGVFNYNDLKSEGLHDEISSFEIKSGARVKFYESVSGGEPTGRSTDWVEGPKTANMGAVGVGNDEVSAIKVEQVGGGGDNGSNGGNGNGGSNNGGNGQSIQGGINVVQAAAKGTTFRIQVGSQIPQGLGPGARIGIQAITQDGTRVQHTFTVREVGGPYGSGQAEVYVTRQIPKELGKAQTIKMFGLEPGEDSSNQILSGVSNTTVYVVGGAAAASLILVAAST